MSEVKPLEVWGGLECSRVRIADEIRDQIVDTGHRDRPEDMGLIADLGIKALRYPVLWETVCRVAGEPDWSWHDSRLEQLRSANISPIVGLVHHGSGPSYCDLLDPAFPQSLARYAADVAGRYPWLKSFTPVNEPMTTAETLRALRALASAWPRRSYVPSHRRRRVQGHRRLDERSEAHHPQCATYPD